MKPPITFVKAKVATTGLRFKTRTKTLGLTVHCSASRPSQNWGAADVDRMHRMQGWLCIGYHFVIRRDGTIEIGRPIEAEGSHCLKGGRNKTHIGVCMIGGVSEKPQKHTPGNPWNGSDAEANFTEAQLASLRALIDRLQFTDAQVEGHRNVPKETKACPSFDVKHWLATGVMKL